MRRALAAAIAAVAVMPAQLLVAGPAGAADAPWSPQRRPPLCTATQLAAFADDTCSLWRAGRPNDQGFATPPFPQTPPLTSQPVSPDQWTNVARGARGPIVVDIQQALVDNTGADLVVDGIFGPVTEAAIKKYQTDQSTAAAAGQAGTAPLAVTGIVDVATATALGVLVTYTRSGPFPPAGWAWKGWAYNGSPALATFEQQMAKQSAAIGPIPAGTIIAQRDVLPLFEGFLRDLVAGGYALRPTEIGAYTFRCTSTTRKDCFDLTAKALSFHAWGAALDINWSTNPQRTYSSSATYPDACNVPVITDLPGWALRAAHRWGLYWLGFGGAACDNPTKPASAVFRDAMHFEFHGTPAEARAIAAHNAGVPRPAYIPVPAPPTPPAPPPTTTTTVPPTTTTTPPAGPPLAVPLRRGSRGTAVRTLQSALVTRGQKVLVDGVYGLQTQGAVKRVQPTVGQPATGVVDANTARALGFTPVSGPPATPAPSALVLPVAVGSKGATVVAVQQALNRRGEKLATDGIFGPLTDAAVRRAQTALKLPVTGVVDAATAAALGLR